MIIQLVTSGADVDTSEPPERQTAGREIRTIVRFGQRLSRPGHSGST